MYDESPTQVIGPDGAPPRPKKKVFQPEPFGKYYLLDKIAVGGMAEVFLSKTFGHSGFERTLIIKRILRHHVENGEFVEMFIDEAKLQVQLTHANIAQIYDFGKIDDDYFIAMEAVFGRDLKGLMRRLAERNQLLSPQFAVLITHELASGLGYAHTKTDSMGQPLHVVHRDISPSNVLVNYEGQVKVIDFGIAKADSGSYQTEAGVLKGKFEYMSPEQSFGLKIDARSDLFSVGICLWEMLTGRRLFKMQSEIQTLEAIKNSEIPLPSVYNPAIPPEVDDVCMRLLDRDVSKRYQNADDLKRDLQDILLPDTPDRIGPDLGAFMREMFAQEVAEEKAALEESTRLAHELHTGGTELDLEMDEPGTATLPRGAAGTGSLPALSTGTIQAVPQGGKGFMGLMVVMMLILMGGVGFVGWKMLAQQDAGNHNNSSGLASLRITVLPAEAQATASITLDGSPIPGDFGRVLPETEHTLRVVATGYEPRERILTLVPGQVFATEMYLQKKASADEGKATPAKATPSPSKATPSAVASQEPSAILFKSNPAAAAIYVDGRKVGLTPYRWRDVPGGKTFQVEYRLEGHETLKTSARTRPGQLTTVDKTLSAVASKEPGKLSVQVSPGWVKVYVNGKYADMTPLFDYELAPGTYQLRLENKNLGVDRTETVSIKAGQVTRVSHTLD